MKKLTPIAVWYKIQPIIDENRQLITPKKSDKYALHLEDADKNSDFYFKLGFDRGNGKYSVEKKPANKTQNFAVGEELDIDGLGNSLSEWLKVLEEYAQISTIYDDPLLKSYEEEFASYIKMEDEDANKFSFNFPQQISLDSYLSKTIEFLETQKANSTQDQISQLETIVNECESLKNDLTDLTKNQTVKRLAKIWAKARKYSLSLVKDLFTDFLKDGIKMLTKSTLEGEFPSIVDLTNMLS